MKIEKHDRDHLRHKLYYGEHVVDALDEAEKSTIATVRKEIDDDWGWFHPTDGFIKTLQEAIERYKHELEKLLTKA